MRTNLKGEQGKRDWLTGPKGAVIIMGGAVVLPVGVRWALTPRPAEARGRPGTRHRS
jgi:hypothetical protein